MPPESNPPLSDGLELLSYIDFSDPLPEGFMLDRRGKLEMEDVQYLEHYLEEKYHIRSTIIDPKRRKSAPPDLPCPTSASFPGPWELLNIPAATLGIPVPSLPESRYLPRRFAFAWIKDHIPRFQTRHMAASGSRVPSSNIGQSLIVPILQRTGKGMFNVLRDLIVALLETFIMASEIFIRTKKYWKLPTQIIFAVLLLLQITACVHSYTHHAFLSSFCPKKLPIISPPLCRSWNEIQQYHPEKPVQLKDIMSPYETILKSNSTSLSYELPNFLRRWETIVRQFRAGLPESHFSLEDQSRLYDLFTAYIKHSNHTVVTAQHFHSHMSGTIRQHISDTTWLTRKLSKASDLNNMTILLDGPMAQGMGWLNAHYMLYLPAGIEPFKQSYSLVSEVTAIDLMKAHVGDMTKRIHVDIEMTTSLQTSLLELGGTSEEIETFAAKSQSDNDVQLNTGPIGVWGFLGYSLNGQTLPDYQIKQRQIWLEAKRPVFRECMTFHHLCASELEGAVLACNDVAEGLMYYGRAARYGSTAPEWIEEQARQMSAGVGALEFQLKNFKTEQMRFNKETFVVPALD